MISRIFSPEFIDLKNLGKVAKPWGKVPNSSCHFHRRRAIGYCLINPGSFDRFFHASRERHRLEGIHPQVPWPGERGTPLQRPTAWTAPVSVHSQPLGTP